MSYLEELLPEFRKGAKIRKNFWDEGFYVYFSRGFARNQNGGAFRFDGDDLVSDSWEFYQAPEPDWQYIIDNGCLCWFWDRNEDKRASFLTRIIENHEAKFVDNNGCSWFKCCPVRRDEVTFYEDKNNE